MNALCRRDRGAGLRAMRAYIFYPRTRRFLIVGEEGCTDGMLDGCFSMRHRIGLWRAGIYTDCFACGRRERFTDCTAVT